MGSHPRMEDEFVESIAALLYYARHRAHIRFTLVSPMNETDIIGMTSSDEHPGGIVEGPDMPDALQFARVLSQTCQEAGCHRDGRYSFRGTRCRRRPACSVPAWMRWSGTPI